MPDPTFNLVDEPWIPCLLRDDHTVHLFGIRETLNRAPEIVEIVDPSPLVTVALHRLLLAILHRCYGPATIDDWQALWEAGRWDDCINNYLDKWRQRFDLFDPAHPFYQVAGLASASAPSPVAKLAFDLSVGNNQTLFDHTIERDPLSMSPDQVARYLVAYQAFAISGTVSQQPGEQLFTHRTASAAPLTNAAVALVRGVSLFQTLMLNLHRYDPSEEAPFPVDPNDAPAWERPAPTRDEERPLLGYLDLLTWQSRRILVFPESTTARVKHVLVMKGFRIASNSLQKPKDTMLAFKRSTKKEGPGWFSLGFQEDRVIWRDSTVLFQSADDAQQRPMITNWLAELVDEGTLERHQVVPLDLVGLRTSPDGGKVLFWRYERLPLPLDYLNSLALLERVSTALEWAEQGKNTLNRGLQLLAERSLVLYPAAEGISKDDRDRAKAIVKGWDAERRFWARLDLAFRRLIEALPDDYDSASDEYGTRRMPAWLETVRKATQDSFNEVERSLDGSGPWLRAAAIARRTFSGELKKLGTLEPAGSEQAT